MSSSPTNHPRHTAHTHKHRASDDDDPALPSSSTTAADAPQPPAAADKTVYVEGLSYGASEEDVTRFFQDKGCGKVLAVRMPRYQDTGRPRGYAHVDFKKADGVDRALALNGVTMMGRYLTVQRAHEPKLGGPQPPAVVQAKPPGTYVFVVVWGHGGSSGKCVRARPRMSEKSLRSCPPMHDNVFTSSGLRTNAHVSANQSISPGDRLLPFSHAEN